MGYYQGKAIRVWAEEDQPREKLITKGAEALTESELLAILLASGNREYSAIDLGRKLIEDYGSLHRLSRATVEELIKYPGIGKAKAVGIVAAFELYRRKDRSEPKKITCSWSGEMYKFLRPHMEYLDHEVFMVILMNNSLEVLGYKTIHTGGLTKTIVDPKRIFKEALTYSATHIVVAHNHPSGNVKPSLPDNKLTEKLRMCAEMLDIKLMDHIIMGNNGEYYSYADHKTL